MESKVFLASSRFEDLKRGLGVGIEEGFLLGRVCLLKKGFEGEEGGKREEGFRRLGFAIAERNEGGIFPMVRV